MAATDSLYKRIIEGSNEGVLVAEDGAISYLNEQMETLLGYTEDDLRGEPADTILAGEAVLPGTTDQTSAGDSDTVERRLEPKEGAEIPVELTLRAIPDTDDTVVVYCRDIRPAKAREQELSQLWKAVEQTPQAVYVTDGDGTIEYVNAAFEEITGYSRDDAIGQTPHILYSGNHDSEYYEEFWETITGGDTWEGEIVDETAEGEEIVLRQSVSPLADESGEPNRFIAVAQDITERKENREALDRSRQQLREVIDLVPDLIYAKNRDGRYLLANEATAEAYGSTPEEVEGSHEAEVIPDIEQSEKFREDDLSVIESGEPVRIPEEELTTADGETKILQTVKIPYQLPGTEKKAVLGYSRDITELKAYERELASERDFLEAVIESLPYPFYVIDVEDYTIQYANSEAIVDEGSTCYEATHERDQPCDEGEQTAPCPMAPVVAQREPVTEEHVHVDESGTERTYQVHAAPIFDEDGDVELMGESTIDISERSRYQQQLEEQRDNLEVLNQVVRHDIRNDLQLVLTYTETLQQYVDGDGEEYAEQVLDAAYDAVDITKTARDVTEVMLQSETDRRAIPLRFALEGELEDVRSNYEHALVRFDGTMPDVEVRADDMLESVFRNLLSNAIQHNDKEVPEVTVTATEHERTVRVEIADNGPGIPDERKDEIFEQGEMSLDSEGTGLGLYLVDKLVGRYGGTVSVRDNDPEGAIFSVELPLASETDTWA